MRCMGCGDYSFSLICKKCKSGFLDVSFKEGIVSFYRYEAVFELLKYKYQKFGSRIYWELGSVLKEFGRSFNEKAYVIPVDDRIKKGYSHTAILAKSLESKTLKPIFGLLHSQNDIQYAGKPLEFRLKNPREFKYTGPENIDAILVDDIKTTGLTLKEAKETLEKNGVNVLFSVVLCRV